MDVLRSGLSIVGRACARRAEGGDSEDALWALAATPAIVADYARLRAGEASLAPDPELGIVENYMLKLSGERPEPAQARALDAYFILAAEHGMNASTFTARVIVSTLSDLGLGARRRRRRAQGAAARRRAEPRLAHDRRDRHGRERRALAAPQARGGRAS